MYVVDCLVMNSTELKKQLLYEEHVQSYVRGTYVRKRRSERNYDANKNNRAFVYGIGNRAKKLGEVHFISDLKRNGNLLDLFCLKKSLNTVVVSNQEMQMQE